MRYKVLIAISIISNFAAFCNSLGISSKLDFGNPQPKLIGTATQYRSVPLPYKSVKREETAKTSGDFDGIGVVCVSSGCNKTESEKATDSVKTDVIVHVHTNVDVNQKNKTAFVDDTPDVPVIVGTAGTNFNQARTFNQGPLVITDFGDTFSSLGPSIPSSVSPSLSQYPAYPSTLHSDSVYVQKSNLPAEPQVDINIKTLPPVTLTMTDDGRSIKDIRYKTNGLELRVPYFEPSYHNHYFGENPPPQMVWYPKRSGFLTPTDYKSKATWKPSFWSSGTVHNHPIGPGKTCTCNNQPTTGLQWHPSRRVYGADPGTQINDKLAPLN